MPSTNSSAPALNAENGTRDETGFGLYIHWPFCQAKCPYCDFNSYVREGVDHARWRTALLRELQWLAGRMPGYRLESIFFGGGTPSLMPPETVAALIAAARSHWPGPGKATQDDVEITLEANPTSAEAARFAGFARAGVNRVSLGVQSLRDDALAFLGRTHDAAQALTALETARAHFRRVSFDLITARPGQGLAAWRAELSEALALGADHLSTYQLTMEAGTPFYRAWRAGTLTLPEEGLAAALYQATQEMCAAADLPAYETSNHARPGQHSRHNLIYWRYQPYGGIGPGAHGRLMSGAGVRQATETEKNPERWLARVEQQGHGLSRQAPITGDDAAEEALMMGLRLREGVPWARLETLAGAAWVADIKTRARALAAQDLVSLDHTALAVCPAGGLVLNAILRHLLA